MTRLPDETRALRQTFGALVGGFVAGFLLVLGLFAYLIVRYGWPERGWWVLPDVVQGVVYSVFGGMFCAAAAATVVSRRHHRLGMHRCFRCNRVLAYGNEPCVCDVERRAQYRSRQRLPNRMLRHFRRRLPWVVLVNVVVLLIAWYGITRPGRPRTAPVAVEVAFLHAVLCIMLASLLHLVECHESLFKRGRRLRLRVTPFVQLLVMWPAVCLIVMGICKALL